MRIFKNGGTTIQIGILHVLLNILLISLLSKVHCTSCYLEMQNDYIVMSFYVLKKINKMQVAGKNFWLVYVKFSQESMKNSLEFDDESQSKWMVQGGQL